jgi:hypothetical protein
MSASAVSEALNEQYNHHIEDYRFRGRAQICLPCLAVCCVKETNQSDKQNENK